MKATVPASAQAVLPGADRARKISGWLAWFAVATGMVALIGWFADVAVLKSVAPGLATMKVNTALGFILAGLALWLRRDPKATGGRKWIGWICALTVLVLGLLTVGEYVFGWRLGIDDILVHDAGSDPRVAVPGRMSLATAQCFVMLALALATIDLERRRVRPADWLSALTVLGGLGGVLGYLFGVDALYRFFPYASMAAHTSLLFVVLGAGVWLARPEWGSMAVVLSPNFGGSFARLGLPVGFALILLTAWLRLEGEKNGLFDAAVGVVIFTCVSVGLLGLVVWLGAKSLNRLHQELLDKNRQLALQAAIVDFSNDAIVAKDLNGLVTSWNAAAERIFGYSAAEMIGQPIRRLVPAELQREEDEIMIKLGRGERIEHFETRRLGLDGRLIHVSLTISPIRDESGRVVGASKVARDVTERHRLDEELRRALRTSDEFKTALDEHAIVAITDPAGRITYVNDKFCTVSKYAREELIGQDHRILNSGHHPKTFFEELWRTIGSGRVWHGEVRNVAKDGSIYWVDTTIVPFLDDQGKPRQYMAVRAEITATKVAQEELARSNRDLEQFAYVASHDLQEPLRAVAGCLEVLKRRYGGQLDAKADELIGHSVDGANRMQALIEGLLAFSRVGTRGARLAAIESQVALDNARRNLATAIRECGAEITQDPMPTLRADVSQLTMLFQNLLGNAIKFRRGPGPKIHVGAERGSEGWTVSVRDDGIGIDAQYFERIFVIFQRLHTRREYPGTGIGLALCKRIVERHGGRIWVESAPGQGTVFNCLFPEIG